MKIKTRLAWADAAIAAVLFTAFVYVFYLVAAWGISDHLAEGIFKDYVVGPGIHLEALIMGLGFGALLSMINRLFESQGLRRLPFAYIILIKTGLYLASLALIAVLVNLALILFFLSSEHVAALRQTVTRRFAVSGALWITGSILAINFIFEVRRKIGPGKMMAFVIGHYQKPRMEDLVFLFLDLKGSTAIAEQLGPKEYSRFLRRCFHDLTDIILTYGAEVYQYVGDEVVLTWPAKGPEHREQCMETFFAFEKKLRERGAWYEKHFGIQPAFRGGVEEGSVTATEVGDIKREIAYHGDPLNTAARLLELCKEFGRDLLVSGSVRKSLINRGGFLTEWQGDLLLRGKSAKVSVYSVSPAQPSTAVGGA
jgi:adenylate cyclase